MPGPVQFSGDTSTLLSQFLGILGTGQIQGWLTDVRSGVLGQTTALSGLTLQNGTQTGLALDGGSVTSPAETIGEPTSGRYRLGLNNLGEAINGVLVVDWNASRIKFAQPGQFPDGTAAAPSITFSGQSGLGFYRKTTDQMVFASGGVNAFLFQDGAGIRLRAANVVAWSSNTDATASADTQLSRASAGVVAVTTGYTAPGAVTAFNATAVPAGGTAGSGFLFSSTANLGVFFGSGLPTLSAAQGALYVRTDGSSTSTRLYVNTNGSTAWTNVTTAT